MANSSKLHCRERQASIWTFALFLILSHGIWNTLQCPPRQSSPVSEPVEEVEESLPITGSETRQTRGEPDNSMQGSEKPIQLCHERLTAHLNMICLGRFHDPNALSSSREKQFRNRSFSKRGEVQLRRAPRSLVNECCINSCTEAAITKYCLFGNRSTIQITSENNGTLDFMKPKETGTPGEEELGNPEQPESTLFYPLLHILNFYVRKQLDVPTTTPPALTFPEDLRELPLPQPRVQDKHFASGYVVSPANPQPHHRMHPQSSNNLDPFNNLVRVPNTDGVAYRGPKAGPLASTDYTSNRAYSSLRHSSSSKGGSRKYNDIPSNQFQNHGRNQPKGDRPPNTTRNMGSSNNAITANYPEYFFRSSEFF